MPSPPQWPWGHLRAVVACEVLMAGHSSCSLIPAANANGKAIPRLFFQRQQAGRFLLLSSGWGRQQSAPGLDQDRGGAASPAPEPSSACQGRSNSLGYRAALSQPEALKPCGEIMSWSRPCLECQEDAVIPGFLCRATRPLQSWSLWIQRIFINEVTVAGRAPLSLGSQ